MLCLIGTVPLAAVFHAGHVQLCAFAGKAQAAGVLVFMGVHIGLELRKGAVEQGHIGLGGVVLILHARAAHHSTLRQLFQNGLGHLHFFTKGAFQVLQRDVAGAEQGGLLPHHRHHGAFHTHIALAAIQNQRQSAVHIGEHILCVGGAGLAGKVCAGGGKGAAALLDDRPRHRVAGHTDAHGIQPGAAFICHLRPARHDDGQRPGAEGCHQQLGALRHLADKTRQHLRPGDVDDKGVILRASLGHKDIAHRRTVAGIGGNAVDRLGGQGHKLTLPQQLRGLGYACFIGRQNSGFDFHTNHRSFYL